MAKKVKRQKLKFKKIIREFVANLSLLVVRPTMAKHNQSPPLGDLGGFNSQTTT
jgi:hypothetical protein